MIHPFLDGNGHLSRFLFHHTLCRSGKLHKGLILPISVAVKRNQTGYRAALRAYSRQVCDRWTARWIDGADHDMRFDSHPSIYRYWDVTKCAEFQMAEQALEFDLRPEIHLLIHYNRISKAVNDRFDVRGSDLAALIVCLDDGGRVSKSRRKQCWGRVPEPVFDYIQALACDTLAPDLTSGSGYLCNRPE